MYQQYDFLAQMARERQAEMRREAANERLLRDAGLTKGRARPLPRKLFAAAAMAALITFVFAQVVNAAH